MDDTRFDRLTRRFVLSGALGAFTTAAHATTADAVSKAKKCRTKGRKFCAGRCCPPGRRCVNRACVQSCARPASCASPVPSPCGAAGCGCLLTVTGGSMCAAEDFVGLQPCGAGIACPAGTVCAVLACSGDTGNQFFCVRPCPR